MPYRLPDATARAASIVVTDAPAVVANAAYAMHDFNPRDPGTFRIIWRFPQLLFPALCAAAVQGVADTIFRGASAVVAGDSGIVLFLRVVACLISVLVPACVWAAATVLTTLLAADAWDGLPITRDTALGAARSIMRSRRTAPYVVAGGYIVFLSLGVVIDHFTDVLFGATLFFTLFALPAIVLDERPAVLALRASYELSRRQPMYVVTALILPAVIVFVATALAVISLGVAFFGPIAAALSTAFACAFMLTHVCGVYLDATRACEPETAALCPPPEPVDTGEVVDAEFIRTHFPPYG